MIPYIIVGIIIFLSGYIFGVIASTQKKICGVCYFRIKDCNDCNVTSFFNSERKETFARKFVESIFLIVMSPMLLVKYVWKQLNKKKVKHLDKQ